MRKLSADFVRAFRASSVTETEAAIASGFTQPRLNLLLNKRRSVPDTTLTNERLDRLADLIGFPREQVCDR